MKRFNLVIRVKFLGATNFRCSRWSAKVVTPEPRDNEKNLSLIVSYGSVSDHPETEKEMIARALSGAHRKAEKEKMDSLQLKHHLEFMHHLCGSASIGDADYYFFEVLPIRETYKTTTDKNEQNT